MLRKILVSLSFLAFFSGSALAQWQQQIESLVQNGTVLAVSAKGEVLFSHRAKENFIPASTLKVPTALMALKTLGPDFRFKTDFYLDGQNRLWVKGYGDPFLVSEEIEKIAAALRGRGLKQIREILLDTTFFDPELKIDGLSASLNPYDAYNGALVANFNTLNVMRDAQGRVSSAEPQTPMTEITAELARDAPRGKSRVNVGLQRDLAPTYFGYLLKEFLRREGVEVSGMVRLGIVPSSHKLFYSHASSKNLSEVLREALKYSQNLINNQIFLFVGAHELGEPVTLAKAQKFYRDFLQKGLGLKSCSVEEASGISRKNQISALDMDRVLVEFFPYHELLPQKRDAFVKTGTLTGVSSLVGYFPSARHGWVRFVIILNQPTNSRDAVLNVLMQNL